MKNAIIKAIEKFSGDSDFRMATIIVSALLVAFVIAVFSIKGCERYEDCSSACGGRYSGNDNVSGSMF